MPSDDRLVVLLRSLQTHSDQQDTPRLLSSASYILATLSNPLNLTVVTTQLLFAPAIWIRPEGLRACVRFMGIFQAAAVTILRYEEEQAELSGSSRAPPPPGQPVIGGKLARDVWVKSVIQGADDRSARWKHLLVLGGLLVGYEGYEKNGLPRSTRGTMIDTLIKTVNHALVDVRDGDELGANSVALVLNYVFPLLTDGERSRIDYDMLLPILVGSAFFSQEGYSSGYFLATINPDITYLTNDRFTWPARSKSYEQLVSMSSQPLITAMGPLSRLIAHTIENTRDPWSVQAAMDDISRFTQTLMSQWRQIKVSEVDVSEEKLYFDSITTSTTLPTLWKILRSSLFAVVIVLRGCINRIVNTASLANDETAPVLAAQALLSLRNMHFVATRLGPNSSSQLTFVYLAAIDILSAYSFHSESFIKAIAPTSLRQIPPHPLDRTLDLYFLNTAEHFTLVLSPQISDEILIPATVPYLDSGASPQLLEIFEAAHSLMLSVISSPACNELATIHLPFYVESLFSAYPNNISSRQFRFAFTTLLRITAPPYLLSVSQPELPEILLDLVHHRTLSVLGNPLPTQGVMDDSKDEHLDEATTLVLTIIDSLPFLSISVLERTLPLVSELISKLLTVEARQKCRNRFWEVLSNGEMGVMKTHLCLAWWTTHGGRDMVMQAAGPSGVAGESLMMSGALLDEKSANQESKL